jgi:hypothetical protein
MRADRGWKRPFDDPIPLPGRRQLVTLKDAADYIMKLPKAEQKLQEWQAATEALIMAAEDRGPLMHAHIGMLRALNRHVKRVFNPDRKDPHWGRRKLGDRVERGRDDSGNDHKRTKQGRMTNGQKGISG